MSESSDSLAKAALEYRDKSLELVHEQAARIAELEAKNLRLAQFEEAVRVECPECESTSIRCHMCGFVSDGPAFLHEEAT